MFPARKPRRGRTRARWNDHLTFLLERLILRGPQWRILVIGVAIALISLAGGVAALGAGESFGGLHDAVWWAFLRLTDPGYLGDDVGAWRRTISTILTILGYVVFLGALIAVMTQWLNQLIRDLERGLTPVVGNGHVLILGWTDRTAAIVRELLLSEGRVQRFLRRQHARSLRIVILAEEVGPALIQELRERLGDRWDGRRIIVRSGTPLRLEHLERVDFLNAGVIVLPGGDFGGRTVPGDGYAELSLTDTAAVKTLLSIANHAADRQVASPPPVVAEVLDARKAPVVERAYGGVVEVVPSDRIVSRLIAQNLRHRGLSHVVTELLTHSRGNAIYVREHARLVGQGVGDVGRMFERAVVLGLLRPVDGRYRPLLNPAPTEVVEAGDRIVLLARHYGDTEAAPRADAAPALMTGAVRSSPPPPEPLRACRVLLLGWSHRVPPLIGELAALGGADFSVDIISALPADERDRQLARYGPRPAVTVRQIEGDYTVPADLAATDPASYDRIVVLGSSWLESREESDARTIVGYLLLRDLLRGSSGPDVLVELMDPGNLALFRERPGEVIISPQIVSHLLAQVALRPELGSVFDELFGPAGAEIVFRGAGTYGIAGRELGFDAVAAAATARREIALGLRFAAEREGRTGGIRLNPSRTARWTLTEEDEVVVLLTP